MDVTKTRPNSPFPVIAAPFTDGVTEAENRQALEFGSERIAHGPSGSSAAETKRRVMKEVAKFCNTEFRDDVMPVVVAHPIGLPMWTRFCFSLHYIF